MQKSETCRHQSGHLFRGGRGDQDNGRVQPHSSKIPQDKKSLTAFNSLTKQLSSKKTIKKELLHKVEKKTKTKLLLAEKMSMSRQKLLTSGTRKVNKVEEKIVAFLKKPENATELPTKRDPGRMSLINTIHNLHAKFLEEHPDIPVLWASFAKKKARNTKGKKIAKPAF